MSPNAASSYEILDRLFQSGVREFCICAGSRNSPLVAALTSGSHDLRLYTFPDERAAAFFALGRCQITTRPVAVVTTSGTAAAEMLPAVVEAHYAGWPLVCVTADRPRRFRGTAAPQSIEQKNLYGSYVEACLDFEAGESWSLSEWSGRKPLHINVCFDEPLLGKLEAPVFSAEAEESKRKDHKLSLVGSSSFTEASQGAALLKEFLSSVQRPLVIVSGLLPEERDSVKTFLAQLGAPIWAESHSGLREDPALESLVLRAGERILSRGGFDGVLRVGGVPTARFWRDLEESGRDLKVCHLSRLPFAGLTRGGMASGDIAQILRLIDEVPTFERPAELFELDRAQHEKFQEILIENPRSELALVHSLSRFVPPRSKIFLGNSLPIREWDLASTRRFRGLECRANRGANGIDGEIATFLGQCDPELSNWALMGDLTALYDLSAPWIVPQLPENLAFQIVVVNNGGGRIFSRVKSLDVIDPDTRRVYFENSHGVRFGDWARMWNLGFEEWTEMPPQPPASQQGVVELRPDADMSARVWDLYNTLWSVS